MEILTRAQVEELTTLSRVTIYRLRRMGKFPAPLVLSKQKRGWLKAEIEEWIATRERAFVPHGYAETGHGGSGQTG